MPSAIFKTAILGQLPKNTRNMNRTKSHNGFTVTEVLFSVILLGIIAMTVTVPYISGLQSLEVQADRMLLDSRLRSRMEVLVGTDFDSLNSGSEVVTVNEQNYTINWNVVLLDLDGDTNPEPTAVQVSVSVAGMSGSSLTTIVVDNEGRIGKIS
jgi:prepilin-type N-terminal cleavage/methylation domain-containing protein